MLPKIKKPAKPIYLDHAATTNLDPRVKKAMEPFLTGKFGNPSSLYSQGRQAATAVSQARETLAKILNAKPAEIVFTAGGTESVNLAILGTARAYERKYKRQGHIVTTAIEHHAVIRSVEALVEEGWHATFLKPDSLGFITPEQVGKAIRNDTMLVSVMYANNEIGTVQPIRDIGALIKKINNQRSVKKPKILFHSDSCQAAGNLDLNVEKLHVDLLSLNASKAYGPKQIGLLYIKRGTPIRPIIFGGGQEGNLRSGTENVPGIVGLAEALSIADKEHTKESARLTILRDYFIKKIFELIPDAVLNGPDPTLHGSRQHTKPSRLPNNVNFSFIGVEGEALLLYLDSYGVAVSTGSACASAATDPSHVLLAIGRPKKAAYSGVRFTLGRGTTKVQLDYVIKLLPDLVKELRQMNT